MNKDDYLKQFKDNVNDVGNKRKMEKAFDIAMDIRKFEIDLYWKRATYFWTFIGAAFAGYAAVYKEAGTGDSWLPLVFSCLGLLFSVAWFLVNRGSKFWQNNWERHVDLLEDEVVGPLFKTIVKEADSNDILTLSSEYSVSKINQLLSLFVVAFWLVLIFKSLWPISCSLAPDILKILVLTVTVVAVSYLFCNGKSEIKKTECKLSQRDLIVES